MIWTLLKLLFSKGLSIKRWNNFPRVEDITPLDNSGFVIHVALFMAHLEEENGEKIDKEYIIKKIIFDLFKSLVLSDINSWTRDYLLKIDKKIMQKLEDKVLNYLYSFEGWDFIKKDMQEIFSDDSKTLEDDIIFAAKKFAGHQECVVNARVFSYAYDVALDEINTYFDENKKKLHSLKEILKNEKYRTYLSHIRRLSHAMRWSWKQRKYDISVMAHLVIVIFLSYILANLENKKDWNYDILEIMLQSAYHDIPEAITWDIITPIKNSVEGFREALEKVEEKMMDDYFFLYVPKEYKQEISGYMLDPFSNKSWRLAKHADIFSALFEARIERDAWSKEFNDIYRDIKYGVNKFDTYSSNFILKDVLLSFGDDILDITLDN